MTDTPDFAALLGSRICHDLISPIGAIGNGVELMMMAGTGAGPELALISESVANASARIRLFRIAFGAASADQRIGRPEVAATFADLTRGGRLAVSFTAPNDLPRAEVKLVFLLFMCLETALLAGGKVDIAHQTSGHWTLSASGTRLRLLPGLWAMLSGGPGDAAAHEPGMVHFALAAAELGRAHRALRVAATDTTLQLSF